MQKQSICSVRCGRASHDGGVKGTLTDELAQSTPGEELVVFSQVPDGNGGQPLPANPLFGETVTTGPPILPPAPPGVNPAA